jgi:hypothetical protein
LEAAGFTINRSGVQWLVEDGHQCRPNEVIGYCNISVEPAGGFRATQAPFADERELQVAFASRCGGRLQIDPSVSMGGYLNALGVHSWEADAVIGWLHPDGGVDEGEPASESLRLLMLAGRRMSGLADVMAGLLPGWHSRSRGWWGDDAAPPHTLLCLGICDALGPVLGDRGGFLEMFEDFGAPAHMVVIPNHPIAPCAPCLVEQFTRSPAEHQAIADDILRALSSGPVKATADDWMFVGALLAAMDRSPMRDSHNLLTPSGLRTSGRPASVLLSLNSEGSSILRHKTMGYHLHILRVYQAAAGPAVRAWLGSAFEPVRRSVDDIRRDYLRLFDLVRAETDARFLILNRMSTSGREDIASYAPFDPPLGESLANVASKEMNLMLHDLSDVRDLSIIDVDAIASELGAANHLPDGVHQSGALQAEVRAEILRAMTGQAV